MDRDLVSPMHRHLPAMSVRRSQSERWFMYACVLAIGLCLGACGGSHEQHVAALAREAANSTSSRSLRSIAVKAIDTGLIREKYPNVGAGTSAETVDVIFGSHPLTGSWKAASHRTDGQLRVVPLGVVEASDPLFLVVFSGDRDGVSHVYDYALVNCLRDPDVAEGGGASGSKASSEPLPASTSAPSVAAVIEELRTAYMGASDEEQRRAIAFRAIDAGIIRRGAAFAAVPRVFGAYCPSATGPQACRIPFLPRRLIQESGKARDERYSRSWYLEVEHDSGAIACFRLSNTHPFEHPG